MSGLVDMLAGSNRLESVPESVLTIMLSKLRRVILWFASGTIYTCDSR